MKIEIAFAVTLLLSILLIRSINSQYIHELNDIQSQANLIQSESADLQKKIDILQQEIDDLQNMSYNIDMPKGLPRREINGNYNFSNSIINAIAKNIEESLK